MPSHDAQVHAGRSSPVRHSTEPPQLLDLHAVRREDVEVAVMRYRHTLLVAALGFSLVVPGSAGAAPPAGAPPRVSMSGPAPRGGADGRHANHPAFRAGRPLRTAVFPESFEPARPGVVVIPAPVTVPSTPTAPPPPSAAVAPPAPSEPETIRSRPAVPHPGSKVIEVSPLPPGTRTVPIIVQRGSSTVVERVPVP